VHHGDALWAGLSRGWLLLCSLTLSACTALSFSAANLPTYFSATQRTADIAFGDDARQRLDIYRPPASGAAAKPVIIFWYGGGWTSGARQNYRFVGVALAQLGYVTVLPDYRLYPQVRFPQFLDDGARAVAWVQRHAANYGGDPQRIIGFIGLSGPYDLTPNTATLHDIFRAPFTPHDWQVLPYVSPQAPPALLLHGRQDQLVWASNTEKLAAALRSQGVHVDTMIYEGRGHIDTLAALSLPARTRAPVLREIADFMRSLQMSAAAPGAGGSSTPAAAAAPAPGE